MKSRNKVISVLPSTVLLVLMFPVVPVTAFPETPNSTEIAAITNFLNQPYNDSTNGEILGYTVSDPSTWHGVSFNDDNGHITAIGFAFAFIGGSLNVSGVSYLESLNLIFNNLTALKLTGCTALKSLRVANNQNLVITDLSVCSALT